MDTHNNVGQGWEGGWSMEGGGNMGNTFNSKDKFKKYNKPYVMFLWFTKKEESFHGKEWGAEIVMLPGTVKINTGK